MPPSAVLPPASPLSEYPPQAPSPLASTHAIARPASVLLVRLTSLLSPGERPLLPLWPGEARRGRAEVAEQVEPCECREQQGRPEDSEVRRIVVEGNAGADHEHPEPDYRHCDPSME